MELVEEHGYDDIATALKKRDGWPSPDSQYLTGNREELDDFAACKFTRKEDWIDLYAKPYYFGCEADDRMNACAFSRANPFGAQLNAIYSSDIGHFDVIDFRDPFSPKPTRELVEEGQPHHRGQFPRLHLRQRGAPLGQAEPPLLRGHGGGQGSGRGAAGLRKPRRCRGRRKVIRTAGVSPASRESRRQTFGAGCSSLLVAPRKCANPPTL